MKRAMQAKSLLLEPRETMIKEIPIIYGLHAGTGVYWSFLQREEDTAPRKKDADGRKKKYEAVKCRVVKPDKIWC